MYYEEQSKKGIELIEFLSGGNHELFHSNLFAFIAKNSKNYFKAIFKLQDLEPDLKFDAEDVYREKNNLDLSIFRDNKFLLVIENKMKSLPDSNQLERYNNKIANQNKEGLEKERKILLTFLDARENSEETGWTTISYKELAQNMRSELHLLNNKPFYLLPLIYDYIEYIEKLYGRVEKWRKEIKAADCTFKALRYWENQEEGNNWIPLFKSKVMFEYICNDLREEIKKIGLENYCNISTGIVRAKPFLEIAVKFNDDKIVNFTDTKNKKEYSVYWIQIYPHEIQQGFTLSFDVKNSLKDKEIGKDKVNPKAKRAELVTNVWQECKENHAFKRIAEQNFNSEKFDQVKFTPVLKGKKIPRAYLYDDAAMVFYVETIESTRLISEYFKTIAENVKSVLLQNEKEDLHPAE